MQIISPHITQQLVAERGRNLRHEITPTDRSRSANPNTPESRRVARAGRSVESDAGVEAPASSPFVRRRPATDDRIGELVTAAAAGDDSAWGALVTRFGPVIAAVARRHQLNDADAADVAQLTWISLYQHIDRLSTPDRVGAWLATTARRECLRILRANGRNDLYGDNTPESASTDPAPADSLLIEERDGALRRGVARLDGRDQTLLGLLVGSCRPDYRSASQVLGMPVGSIGPTRQRALQRLREELESSGDLSLLRA